MSRHGDVGGQIALLLLALNKRERDRWVHSMHVDSVPTPPARRRKGFASLASTDSQHKEKDSIQPSHCVSP